MAVKELALTTHCGVIHLAGPDYLDRMTFARLACSMLGMDATFLHPRPTAELGQRAPRPLRGGLDAGKVRRMLTTPLIGPPQGLSLMRDQLRAHGMLP